MEPQKQIFQMQKKGFEDISLAVKDLKPKDPVQKVKLEGVEVITIKGDKGEPGKDGYTPEKGVDYYTEEEQSAFVDDIMGRIRVPLDGEPGKDAEPIDYSKVEKFIVKEVAKIPKPKDPIPADEESIIAAVLKKIPKQKDVVIDYPSLKKFCLDEITKIENNRESRVRQLNSGGPTTRISEISDVNVTGLSVGQVLSWDGTAWVPTDMSSGSSGSSTTDIKAYVAKTANYTVTASDYTVNCTANTFTVTLLTAVGRAGQIFVIKNSGTGVITIATTSSQTIDGLTTQTLSIQNQFLTVQSTGANWIII